MSSASEELEDDEDVDAVSSANSNAARAKPNASEVPRISESSDRTSRRKRKHPEADLEGLYLQKLAREEEKEHAESRAQSPSKRRKGFSQASEGKVPDFIAETKGESTLENEEFLREDEDGASDIDLADIPKHETLEYGSSVADLELDKAARTVFLANVSTTAMTSKLARKTLVAHLSSPLSSITQRPASTTKPPLPHKLLTLRFRSTAYAPTLPKKAAYATATSSLNPATTPSTNAYAVYSTPTAARVASRALNATIILSRHLRADLVAHPQPIDHQRCVFVGNLGFVDDETSIKAAESRQSSNKTGAARSSKPLKGDVEEGLWRAFSTVGKVESVRVVRDAKTRIGKGFGYVQFADQVGVEDALGMDGKKFPPLLPRKLRVVRAKKPSSTALARERAAGVSNGGARGKAGDKGADEARRPLEGRTRKLLGKAAAAAAASSSSSSSASGANRTLPTSRSRTAGNSGDTHQPPESFIFEGHRASSKQGGGGIKGSKSRGLKATSNGGSAKAKGKSKGKPTTRSAKRGGEWKRKMGTGRISGRRAAGRN